MFLIKFTLPFNFSSAVFEMGNTKVIAAVYGPREVPFNIESLFEMFSLQDKYLFKLLL
jgi:hypothetical protein